MADAAEQKPLKGLNVFNVCCATILVGAETVGAGAAAGWALAGMFRLGDGAMNTALYIGAALGVVGMAFFFRAAKRAEPFR